MSGQAAPDQLTFSLDCPVCRLEKVILHSFQSDTMRDRLKRSCWCLVSVLLLVDSCAGALLDRRRRQVDGGLGKMVSQFLQSDDQTQLNYVRYGLNLLEDGVNGSLGELQGSQGAEDRIFLGSVQVRIGYSLVVFR